VAKQKLGRVEEINPREIWPDEKLDFTPWLSDNLDLLGDALDLSLTLVGCEVPIGPYAADIVAATAQDEPRQVVVENQLAPTNHDHLGKVITYGAGRDASYLVWIATEFREEHRSALDWLNRTSGGQVGYFGVVLRCIKIGDSDPAPQFLVMCRPNIFSDLAEEKDGSTLSETKRLQLEFWTQLKGHAEQGKFPLRFQKPKPQYWTDLAIGRAGIYLSLVASMQDRRAGCKLYVGVEDAWAVIDALLAKRTEIESELGGLEWPDRGEDKKHLTVRQWNEIDVSDRLNWPRAFDWLLDRALAFRKIFQPIVTKFPAKA
jgi:hypothetical protein